MIGSIWEFFIGLYDGSSQTMVSLDLKVSGISFRTVSVYCDASKAWTRFSMTVNGTAALLLYHFLGLLLSGYLIV